MLYTNPRFTVYDIPAMCKRKISSDCICMSQEIRLTIYNYLMVDFLIILSLSGAILALSIAIACFSVNNLSLSSPGIVSLSLDNNLLLS